MILRSVLSEFGLVGVIAGFLRRCHRRKTAWQSADKGVASTGPVPLGQQTGGGSGASPTSRGANGRKILRWLPRSRMPVTSVQVLKRLSSRLWL